MPITTTLNRIRACHPCGLGSTLEGHQKLVARLGSGYGQDEPIPFAVIVESSGLDHAIWCIRAEPQHRNTWLTFAVWCVRQTFSVAKNRDATDDARKTAESRRETWAEHVGPELAVIWARGKAAAAAWMAEAREDAMNAAREAAREAQTAKFLEIVS